MSKSKLGQSLMRTIDGGKVKVKDDSTLDNVVDDAFEQASKNDSGPVLEIEQPVVSEPQIGDTDEILSTGEPIEAPIRAKPEKVKPIKQKKGGGFIGVVTLLLSLIALGLAGFSVVSQKASQMAVRKDMESLDSAIGSLKSTVESMTAKFSDTQKEVQSNTSQIAELAGVNQEVKSLREDSIALIGKVDRMSGVLDSRDESMDKYQIRFNELEAQIKKLRERKAKAERKQKLARSQQQAANNKKSQEEVSDPSMLESAYLASIDTWGTQTSVMLREGDGGWIPMSVGDYYKGWRFQGAADGKAVFKNDFKTKELAIRE